MNALYQLASSTFVMALAIFFLLAAKKLRPAEPSITILGSPSSNSHSNARTDAHGADSNALALQLLITNGISVCDSETVCNVASENGLVYWHNLSDIQTSMKNEMVNVMVDSAGIINRQLMACAPSSGLILAHIASGSISVAD